MRVVRGGKQKITMLLSLATYRDFGSKCVLWPSNSNNSGQGEVTWHVFSMKCSVRKNSTTCDLPIPLSLTVKSQSCLSVD